MEECWVGQGGLREKRRLDNHREVVKVVAKVTVNVKNNFRDARARG